MSAVTSTNAFLAVRKWPRALVDGQRERLLHRQHEAARAGLLVSTVTIADLPALAERGYVPTGRRPTDQHGVSNLGWASLPAPCRSGSLAAVRLPCRFHKVNFNFKVAHFEVRQLIDGLGTRCKMHKMCGKSITYIPKYHHSSR